ncbi:MAG: DMT family transporter [Pseudomonadota bacterium]
MLAGVAWALLAAVIWGGYLAFARAGVVAGLTAFDIMFIRFAIAGAILAPWFVMAQLTPATRIPWHRACVMALLIGPPFLLLGVGGFAHAPLADAALLQPATLLVGTTALSLWWLNERLRPGQFVAIVIVLCGLALTFGPSLTSLSGRVLLGDLMFVTAALLWALFAILQRRWQIPPLHAAAAVSVLSAVCVVPPYLLARGFAAFGTLSPAALFGQVAVHGILVGIVAIVAFTQSVARLGPQRAALFPALVPGLALVIGLPVTGEIPTAHQWFGLGIVSLGLVLGAVPSSGKMERHSP